MSIIKDMIAHAIFTTAVDKLARAAKKNGLDADEAAQVFDAVIDKHWPQKLLTITGIGPGPAKSGG